MHQHQSESVRQAMEAAKKQMMEAAQKQMMDVKQREIQQQPGNQNNHLAPLPTPSGVMDLIEIAHSSLGTLQDAVGTLRATLHPVTLPASETGEGCMQQAPSDAPAVSALRALIERIGATRDGVVELTNSVRV